MIHNYPATEYKREHNILKSFIPEELWDILRLLRVRIAGGALTSLFTNREVNDLDLYFRTWDDLEVFMCYMYDTSLVAGKHDLTRETKGFNHVKRTYLHFKGLDGQEPTTRITVNLDRHQPPEVAREYESTYLYDEDRHLSGVVNLGMTDKSVMFSNGHTRPVIQCIAFSTFDSPQDIFDKFDYTINMGAFNFETEEWEFHRDFMKHLAQKVLVLNPGTDYPIISMLRASKYQARGYTISRRETMKLGIAASRLDMNSWADAKAHLSGMYGTNLETLFDEKDEFSFDRLFDKLDTAGDAMVSRIATMSEKGKENSGFNLRKVTLFQAIQCLRMHTGRPYVEKLIGVCPSDMFYLFSPDPAKAYHRYGIGVSSMDGVKKMSGPMPKTKGGLQALIEKIKGEKQDNFYRSMNLFIDEREARSLYDSATTKGLERDDWGNRAGLGACLLNISIDKPENINMDEGCEIDIIDKIVTKLTIEDMVETNGDIS